MSLMSALMVWGLVSQVMLNQPFGNNPAPDWGLYLSTALVVLLDVLMVTMYLELKVSVSGLEYRFFPFVGKKKVSWHQIEQVYVRQYKPIGEYGGWGIRFQPGRRSRALNVSGTIGLQLVFKDGARLLIGTQKGNELEAALALTNGPYADVDWPGKKSI